MRAECTWLAVLLAGWTLAAGCSNSAGGCRYDVDCPGTQRCLDGACGFSDEPEPCAGTVCGADEICVDDTCLAKTTDADEDGWTVQADCDDSDASVYPGAAEVCNQIDDDCDGATDEDLFCGQDCVPTDQPPAVDPPAVCDASTACEQCYVYESTHYYCRDLAGVGYAWLALPQMTPCTSAQHCQMMTCEQQRHFHCDARVGAFVDGTVPTAEAEACNGFDDNCDGATDEPGAEALCAPHQHATASCQAGACQYTCEAGTHDCAGSCLDDASPNSCGDRCTPCLPPANADAICAAGACDFQCRPGYQPQAGACAACDSDQACGPNCSACPPGTSCCGDDCYDLLADPTHCGGCLLECPQADDSCCAGQGCCPADTTCCNGLACCAAGEGCCTDGCCPATYPVCCPDGCCQAAYPVCCPDGCCQAAYPVCCTGGCCPAGTTCCAQGCCSLKAPASAPVPFHNPHGSAARSGSGLERPRNAF